MLTPKFSLTQDEAFLYIAIYVPHLKLHDTECHVEDDEVYFYSQPYYLRLHLPGKVVENERSKSSYDADTGWLSLSLPKQNRGEHFENLDMLTKLLTPKSSSYECPQVEVLHSEDVETVGDQDQEPSSAELGNCKIECNDDELLEFDWFIEQTPVSDADLTPSTLLAENFCYGFASQKTTPLTSLSCELSDMIDLKEPDSVSPKDRKALRWNQEEESFCCEHYLADLFDDSVIQEILRPDLKALTEEGEDALSEKEQEQLLQLPRREYIIEDSALNSVYLGLVDILLGYAFDVRQTQGEHSVESDWTICKLSSSLSWLDSFTDLKEVLVSFARRCLCFPLYRNWALVEKVISDVKFILEGGKLRILKCLLDTRMILMKSETHFPLVEIFLTDYCVWIQSASQKRLKSLSKALSELHVSKDDVGFRLVEMEEDAAELMGEDCHDGVEKDEDTDLNKLAAAVSNVVHITDAHDSDDDEEEEDDSDEEDDSSEEDTSSSESESADELDETNLGPTPSQASDAGADNKKS